MDTRLKRGVSINQMLWLVAAVLVGLTAACSGGLLAWVAVSTSESAEKADDYLALLQQGHSRDAYMLTASAFQAGQSEEEFVSMVRRLGVTDYGMRHWSDRTLARDGRVALRGTLETDSGRPFPFTVLMVRDGKEWRVEAFFEPALAVAGPGAWFTQIPTESEMRMLVRAVLVEFDDAVKTEDFTGLYNTMSLAFRIDTPQSHLRQAYQHFIDKGMDVSGIADVEAIFEDGPRMEDIETLVVSGYYPTEPDPVPFTLRFTFQELAWRPRFIHVGEPAPLPAEKQRAEEIDLPPGADSVADRRLRPRDLHSAPWNDREMA